jgi:uncharacterized delta-60 repeat protein
MSPGVAVVVQPDNKIVVSGYAYNSTATLYSTAAAGLLRLNVNGTLDETFGSSGRVVTTAPAANTALVPQYGAAIDSFGRIVTAGFRSTSATAMALYAARYNANGTLDTSDYATTPGNGTYSQSANYLTAVGSFPGSSNFYGTFDQTGNAWEITQDGGFGVSGFVGSTSDQLASAYSRPTAVTLPGGPAIATGGSGGISVGSSAALNLATEGTFEVTFQVGELTNTWTPLIHKSSGTGNSRNYTFWLNRESRFLHFSVNNSDGSYATVDTAINSIQDGVWYRATGVMSRASGTLSLYLNGALVGTSSLPTNLTAPTGGNLLIGTSAEPLTSYSPFKGSIDNVRIWNVAKPAAEVLALMARNAPLSGNEPGLVAYYKFDEGSGTNVANSATGASVAGGATLPAGAAWLTAPAADSFVGFRVASSTAAVQPVSTRFVTVVDAGNLADTSPAGFGAVADEFRIQAFEFTNAEYAAFLNTVDPTGANAYGLWNPSMGSDTLVGGITRNASAAPGSCYAVKAGMGGKPVTFVSWFDAARVANWLHNGGTPAASTEQGAYLLLGRTSGPAVLPSAGARYRLPTENQWHKAAFYRGGSTTAGYWDYATATDEAPTQASSAASGNRAVFGQDSSGPGPADVGAVGGPSIYGAYDLSGNVAELVDGGFVRGGSYRSATPEEISATGRVAPTTAESADVGFRLASGITARSFIASTLFSAPTGLSWQASSPAGQTPVSGTLSWSPPTLAGAAITDYVIQLSTDGGTTWSDQATGVPGVSTSHALAAIPANGPLNMLRIAARGPAGFGAFSDPHIIRSATSGTAAVTWPFPITTTSGQQVVTVNPGLAGMPAGTVRGDGRVVYDVGVTLADAGRHYTDAVPVAVLLLPPVMQNVGQQSATEGTLEMISLGSFSGPDLDGTGDAGTTWTVSVSWYDEASPTKTRQTTSFQAPRGAIDLPVTFPAFGTYRVTATVSDNDGQSDSRSFSVVVQASTPEALISGASASMAEGDSITLAGGLAIASVDDQGLPTKVAVVARDGTWSVGRRNADGSSFTTIVEGLPGAGLLFAPTDGGTYRIGFSAIDGRTGAGVSETPVAVATLITVADRAPSVAIRSPVSPSGGVPASAWTVADTLVFVADVVNGGPADTITAWNWSVTRSDGSPVSLPGGTTTLPTLAFQPQGAGDYVVSVEVTDDDGLRTTAVAAAVRVNGLGPSFTAAPGIVGLPATGILEGEGVSLTAPVSLPGGEGSTLTYLWTVTRNGVAFPLPGSVARMAALAFVATDDGDYAVNVVVTDGEGRSIAAAGGFVAANAVPQVTSFTLSTGTAAVEQGTAPLITASVTDPGASDAVVLDAWFSLDGGDWMQGLRAAAGTFTYQPVAVTLAGDHVVRMRLIDKDGGESLVEKAYRVANARPIIDDTFRVDASSFSADESAFSPLNAANLFIRLSGSFSDKGAAGETYRGLATVTYLDDEADTGTTVPLLVALAGDPEDPSTFTFELPYAFTSSGTYTIAFTVIDSQGGVSDERVVTVQAVDGQSASGSSMPAVSFTGASFEIVKAGDGRLNVRSGGSQPLGTVVESGTLVVTDPTTLGGGSLRIGAGAQVVTSLRPTWSADGAGTLALRSLSIASGGVFDIGLGRVTVAAGGFDVAAIRDAITAGGTDGFGIVSAAAGQTGDRTVGYVIEAGELSIGRAAAGDTNLDGVFDIQDAANLLAADTFDTGGAAAWWQGDFNYDGLFDVQDVAAILASDLFDRGLYATLPSPAIEAGGSSPGGAGGEELKSSAIHAAFVAFGGEQQSGSPARKRTWPI